MGSAVQVCYGNHGVSNWKLKLELIELGLYNPRRHSSWSQPETNQLIFPGPAFAKTYAATEDGSMTEALLTVDYTHIPVNQLLRRLKMKHARRTAVNALMAAVLAVLAKAPEPPALRKEG